MKLDGIWGSIFGLKENKRPLAEILHGVPLFADLSSSELQVLEEAVHPRTYQAGETVFAQITRELVPDRVFLVVRLEPQFSGSSCKWIESRLVYNVLRRARMGMYR